jgi:hypothetical protein
MATLATALDHALQLGRELDEERTANEARPNAGHADFFLLLDCSHGVIVPFCGTEF